MKPKYFDVGVYYNHGRTDTISFNKRWKQVLFHWLINRSIFHNGTLEQH